MANQAKFELYTVIHKALNIHVVSGQRQNTVDHVLQTRIQTRINVVRREKVLGIGFNLDVAAVDALQLYEATHSGAASPNVPS